MFFGVFKNSLHRFIISHYISFVNCILYNSPCFCEKAKNFINFTKSDNIFT